MSDTKAARTFIQDHVPRKYAKGRRRVSVYVAWSYPGEANRDVTSLDNRYSTMTEMRRVLWPSYEGPEWSDPMRFQQGIAGSLELFFWGWGRFQKVVGESTGNPVPIFQRVDHAGFRLPLDERVLGDVDTLFVFGLDHVFTEQDARPAEIDAVRSFLEREGTCLVLGPHHDIGASEDMKQRDLEHAHHGDVLVPRQQRFGRYTRSLMKGLGIPVENRYGLRPAVVTGTKKIAPLTIARELDQRRWLAGVDAFSFHQHLPHYAVTSDDPQIHVLARQPMDLDKPHPFSAEGHREFNSLVWIPPNGKRGGDVLVVDSTVFSTQAGVEDAPERFWRNLATAM